MWKNDWTAQTTYYKDDVIAYGGKIYICVLGHSSADDFFTDLDITPSKWNIVSDGQAWLGDWAPQTDYIYDNIVKYGARLYICKTNHTSAEDSATGLEADLDKWEIYAEGLEWQGNWTTSFDYKINDFVKWGGSTYVCNEGHISAATEELGLEADQSKWTIFNEGFDWKQDWVTGTRYKVNDVVKFGASLWIANTYHTASAQFGTDSAKWDKFVEGFQYESEWSPYRNYQPGDIVQYGGNQYIAIEDVITTKPTTVDTTSWRLFSRGLRFVGDWNEDSTNIEYLVGDVVRLGGTTYRCIADHTNQQPPNVLYWTKFTSGINWRGVWLDDQEYYEGDVVRYGDNSYICVTSHISEGDDYSSNSSGAEDSRPDLDTTGTYWNIIAVGTEQSVLTTKGDMVYFSNGGPTRLPIGEDGQVLTVSPDGIPEWAFLGNVGDVYYVAEHGVDSPAPIYGKNIDRPWKSIRYATQQIEKGTKHPKAAELLRLNRIFIQKEIVEWTKYQIANTITPFTGSFDFNTNKCERDMGLLVDAFIWDLTHGGNVRSREAALAYVNETTGSEYLNQKAETVASIQYGLTLIQKVLEQTAPDVNYQETNGDNSTRVAEQYFIPEYGNQANIDYEGVTQGSSSGGEYSGSVSGTPGYTGSGLGGY